MKKLSISYDALQQAILEQIAELSYSDDGSEESIKKVKDQIGILKLLADTLGSARYGEPDRKKYFKSIFN